MVLAGAPVALRGLPRNAMDMGGGYVASRFASKDAPGFVLIQIVLIQMMMVTFVLAAVVALIVYGQSLVNILPVTLETS